MQAKQTDGQGFRSSVELNLRIALESLWCRTYSGSPITGIHRRFSVQTISMGISTNPPLSGQSRRLYIGNIASGVSKDNPTGFNDEMVELGIGADGPSKSALAVQCNYERNYALLEVGGHCYGNGYSHIHILLYLQQNIRCGVTGFISANSGQEQPCPSAWFVTNVNNLAAGMHSSIVDVSVANVTL